MSKIDKPITVANESSYPQIGGQIVQIKSIPLLILMHLPNTKKKLLPKSLRIKKPMQKRMQITKLL